jgi:hypothetical protein
MTEPGGFTQLLGCLTHEMETQELMESDIGMEAIERLVVNRLRKDLIAHQMMMKDLKEFPIASIMNERGVVTEFLRGRTYVSNSGRSAMPSLTVCKIIALKLTCDAIIGEKLLISGFRRFPTICDNVQVLYEQRCGGGRDGFFSRFFPRRIVPEITVQSDKCVFDFCGDFSLIDVFKHMESSLTGARRTAYVLVPYSEELIQRALEASTNSIDFIEKIDLRNGMSVSVGHKRLRFFAINPALGSFSIDTDAYIELHTRPSVLTTGPYDYQIETDTQFPGYRVLRVSTVRKEFRQTAEEYVRESTLTQNLLADMYVRSYHISEAGISVDRAHIVKQHHYASILTYAMMATELKADEVLNYATTTLMVKVKEGPSLKLVTIYDSRTITAIAAHAFSTAYQRRFETSQVLASIPDGANEYLPMLSKYGSESLAYCLGLTLFKAVTVGVEVSSLLSVGIHAVGGIATSTLASLMWSVERSRGFLHISLLKFLNWIEKKDGLLRVEQFSTTLFKERLEKTLSKDLFRSEDYQYEVDTYVKEYGVYVRTLGLTYLQVPDGDVFDAKGRRYILFSLLTKEKQEEDVQLFSKKPREGFRQMGALYSTGGTDIPESYVGVHIGSGCEVFMNPPPSLKEMDDPELKILRSIYLSDHKNGVFVDWRYEQRWIVSKTMFISGEYPQVGVPGDLEEIGYTTQRVTKISEGCSLKDTHTGIYLFKGVNVELYASSRIRSAEVASRLSLVLDIRVDKYCPLGWLYFENEWRRYGEFRRCGVWRNDVQRQTLGAICWLVKSGILDDTTLVQAIDDAMGYGEAWSAIDPYIGMLDLLKDDKVVKDPPPLKVIGIDFRNQSLLANG